MPNSSRKTFLFLPSFTDGRKISRREFELRDSQARTHAAVASHPKNKYKYSGISKTKQGSGGGSAHRLKECRESLDYAVSAHRITPRRSSMEEPGNEDESRLFLVPSAAVPDPFATFVAPLNVHTAKVVRYFHMMWTRLAVQAALPSQHQRVICDASVKDIVQSCMQNELAHDAFTAAVAMRMITIHEVYASKVHAEHSAGRAISRLRTHIASGGNLSSHHFLPILFLAAYEMYALNLAGCHAHLSLLYKLGAHQVLDGYLLTFCHNLDVFCASSALCRPVFPIETPLNTIAPPNSVRVNVSIETFAKHRHLLGPVLTDSLIPLVLDCALAAEICRQTFTPFSAGDLDQLYKDVMDRCNSLKYLLLNCFPGSPEQEACIIAFLIWLSYLPIGTFSSAATEDFRRLIPSRGRALLQRLQQWGSTDLELQLWTAAVGLTFSLESEVIEGCAGQVVRLAQALGVGNDTMTTYLESYLWLSGFDLIKCGANTFIPLAA